MKVPNFKSMRTLYKYFEARKIIEEEVKSETYIIVRNSTIGNIAVKYAIKYQKPYAYENCRMPTWDDFRITNLHFKEKNLAPFAYLRTKKIAKNSEFCL